jgi:hypothetical protein
MVDCVQNVSIVSFYFQHYWSAFLWAAVVNCLLNQLIIWFSVELVVFFFKWQIFFS